MEIKFCFIFLIALAHICVICANMEKEGIKASLALSATKLLGWFMALSKIGFHK